MHIRFLLSFAAAAALLAQTGYQKPPKPIQDILDAPAPPALLVSPARTHALVYETERYPSIARVAAPMLRLAGLRIDPKTNGLHLAGNITSLSVQTLPEGKTMPVPLPPGARLGRPAFSPDGKLFAFPNYTENGIELWIADTATAKARKVNNLKLNLVMSRSNPFEERGDLDWLADSKSLIVPAVPAGRGAPPAAGGPPAGPNIQESLGKAGPVPTYQDMLKSPLDEALFEYYATSQLVLVDAQSLKTSNVGKPAIFLGAEPSPSGKYLSVAHVHKPFSYLHPATMFPQELEVWTLAGEVAYKIGSRPTYDGAGLGGDNVPTGPRAVEWMPAEPNTIVWVEALDGGNPKTQVPHRDKIMVQRIPARMAPAELFRTQYRFQALTFGEKGDWAFVRDFERDSRRVRTQQISLRQPGEPKVIWSRNQQDRYRDPGTPVQKTLASGHRAIAQDGDSIYLQGNGASPQGDRPFLDRYNLVTGKSERLFQSDENRYETFVAMLAGDASSLVIRRESPTEPPNYFLKTCCAGEKALTAYRDPAPAMRGVKKELVTYQRNDGVPLSFTLYLPPDYKPGTRLPAVMWAYPREYNDADTAGQISGSTKRFNLPTGASHLFFLLAGYAILDDATLPIIGTPEKVNDTYVEQLVAGAKAAIDKAAALGVVDPDRVGVGGHSYGGFMTANLLAHSDLFRAGLARSGAYNRTLTPFGFQSERRTFWEAKDTYLRMSPFMLADKIKEPILFIHGEADNNTGTFPIQSERMYAAVRGNGGTTRLVMLPAESHGYQAKESIEHCLYEMITWLNRYVKDPPPRASGGQ
jgi:dipeptidyl aminopeptidase/acylaminoacyl peptidase